MGRLSSDLGTAVTSLTIKQTKDPPHRVTIRTHFLARTGEGIAALLRDLALVCPRVAGAVVLAYEAGPATPGSRLAPSPHPHAAPPREHG